MTNHDPDRFKAIAGRIERSLTEIVENCADIESELVQKKLCDYRLKVESLQEINDRLAPNEKISERQIENIRAVIAGLTERNVP